jgi:drug/metabolite transporter (DMT)-like permease
MTQGNTHEVAARRLAILSVLGSSASFTVSAALVKAVAADFPTAELVLFRSAVCAAVLLPLLLLRHGGRSGGSRGGGGRSGGGLGALRVRRVWPHIIRTLFGFIAMWTSFYGLGHLPLATNTALGFVMPLMLTLLSIPLLGERVGWRRMSAVLAGLLGVLVMVRPWNALGGEAGAGLPLAPTLWVLGGVLCWALAMITIRQMGASGESNATIVLWFSLGGSLLAGVAAAPVWITPGGWDLLALVGIGLVSALAQLLMTQAYRTGESSLIAPFEYTAIVYTTAMGMAIWGEYPDAWTWAGIAIIVAAGLYVWRREVVVARRS